MEYPDLLQVYCSDLGRRVRGPRGESKWRLVVGRIARDTRNIPRA